MGFFTDLDMESKETYRGDLVGKINRFGQDQLSFVQRTLEIDIGHVFAKIKSLSKQRDETVFDLNDYVGALFDSCLELSCCGDLEGFATVVQGLVMALRVCMYVCMYVWWVRNDG